MAQNNDSAQRINANFIDYVMCPKKINSIKISKCVKCKSCKNIGRDNKTLGYFVICKLAGV